MNASAILKLQSAGFSTEQVTALADLIDIQAASKSDLEGVEHRLDTKVSEVKAEVKNTEIKLDGRINLVQWMMGFILAFQIAIFLKLVMH